MTNEEAIKVLLDEWKCIDRNDGINCDRKCESCDLVMDSFVLKDAYNMAIKALEYDDAKYHEEHGEVIVYKAVWEDAERALSGDYFVGVDSTGRFVKASEAFCDRNICMANEYNGIGCDECEVTKSQEPCGDAISRQGDDRWLLHFGQNMAIPSAEPKWIPCSERLPEYTDDYTVTVGINNGNRMYYAVRTALYQIRFNQWIVYESEKTLVGEVIAWQESPEPYKAERSDKE